MKKPTAKFSLTASLLNGTKGLNYVCLPEELQERQIVLNNYKRPIRLIRTFNMLGERFWRVEAVGHPSHHSDLSLEGLKYWKII